MNVVVFLTFLFSVANHTRYLELVSNCLIKTVGSWQVLTGSLFFFFPQCGFSLNLDKWSLVLQLQPYSHPSPLCGVFVFSRLTIAPRVSSRPVSYPENHYSLSPAGGDRVLPYRNPSASFSSPSSGLVGLSTMGPPGITPGPFVRYKHSPDRYVCVVFCSLSSPPSLLWSCLMLCLMLLTTIIVCFRGGLYHFRR